MFKSEIYENHFIDGIQSSKEFKDLTKAVANLSLDPNTVSDYYRGKAFFEESLHKFNVLVREFASKYSENSIGNLDELLRISIGDLEKHSIKIEVLKPLEESIKESKSDNLTCKDSSLKKKDLEKILKHFDVKFLTGDLEVGVTFKFIGYEDFNKSEQEGAVPLTNYLVILSELDDLNNLWDNLVLLLNERPFIEVLFVLKDSEKDIKEALLVNFVSYVELNYKSFDSYSVSPTPSKDVNTNKVNNCSCGCKENKKEVKKESKKDNKHGEGLNADNTNSTFSGINYKVVYVEDKNSPKDIKTKETISTNSTRICKSKIKPLLDNETFLEKMYNKSK